jgi:hypothetical protein
MTWRPKDTGASIQWEITPASGTLARVGRGDPSRSLSTFPARPTKSQLFAGARSGYCCGPGLRAISVSLSFYAPSSSWLKTVEGYFAKLSKQHLKRGVFRSVAELKSALTRFIKEINQMPQTFVLTADPDTAHGATPKCLNALRTSDCPIRHASETLKLTKSGNSDPRSALA